MAKKKEKKTGLHKIWLDDANDPVLVTKKDGTQILYHPDGAEEVITEDHPDYDHLHGK